MYCIIDNHTSQIILGPCYFDNGLGQDFLQKIQFNINSDEITINCMDMTVPVQSPDYFLDHICLCYVMFFDDVEVDSFAPTITKSLYQPVYISIIADAQNHLSVRHRNALTLMVNKHLVLFDCVLKVYYHRLVYLDIIQNATPWQLHAYPMAHIHLDVFKAALSCLCDMDILESCAASQWVLPTIRIPKKVGSVYWVSDISRTQQKINVIQ